MQGSIQSKPRMRNSKMFTNYAKIKHYCYARRQSLMNCMYAAHNLFLGDRELEKELFNAHTRKINKTRKKKKTKKTPVPLVLFLQMIILLSILRLTYPGAPKLLGLQYAEGTTIKYGANEGNIIKDQFTINTIPINIHLYIYIQEQNTIN